MGNVLGTTLLPPKREPIRRSFWDPFPSGCGRQSVMLVMWRIVLGGLSSLNRATVRARCRPPFSAPHRKQVINDKVPLHISRTACNRGTVFDGTTSRCGLARHCRRNRQWRTADARGRKMRAPRNQRVFVVGYGAATPLGADFSRTWEAAARGESGIRPITRCPVDMPTVAGEIVDWEQLRQSVASPRERQHWNAAFVLLTVAVCVEAWRNAGLRMDESIAPRTACLVGSAINGIDAFREGMESLRDFGPNGVSPFLLPNVCANVPAGLYGCPARFHGSYLLTARRLRLRESRDCPWSEADRDGRLRRGPRWAEWRCHSYRRSCKASPT